MKSPTPTIDKREIKTASKNNQIDPAKGTLKQVITIKVIISVNIRAIISGGMVFPSKISKDDNGLL